MHAFECKTNSAPEQLFFFQEQPITIVKIQRRLTVTKYSLSAAHIQGRTATKFIDEICHSLSLLIPVVSPLTTSTSTTPLVLVTSSSCP